MVQSPSPSGEAHSSSCLKFSVKFPQPVMIWGAMSSAGVGPLCFLKTNITALVYQEMLEHFMLPSADLLFKDADLIFQQDLAPAHTAKSTKSWLNDHGVGVLDWPANSPDLNPIENVWGIVKKKMRNKRPKNADELKATVKETWFYVPYRTFRCSFKEKCPQSGAKTQVKYVNPGMFLLCRYRYILLCFYYIATGTYCSGSEFKYSGTVAKKLYSILLEICPTPNPILNLPDSVNKCKTDIKTYLLIQLGNFNFLIQI